jgi:hypothetical protein
MDSRFLKDRVAWASNLTARRIGTLTDAFRPTSWNSPLALRNRYLRLHAAFSATPTGFGQVSGYGNAVCYGHFDFAYTRGGDYLVQDGAIYFIASQDSMLPAVCVRTNRRLTFRRPSGPTGIGSNGYGGLTSEGLETILDDWPASVLGMATGGTPWAGLPLDTAVPQWTVLMPCLEGHLVRAADLVEGDDGLRGVIVVAERSALGWRMTVRQVST